VAVILTEALKILACMSVLLFGCWRTSRSYEELGKSICDRVADLLLNSLPMAVPAAMYVMQQVLVIVAATHLDVVTFQICNQMKVFPTAIFASSLLGQHLSALQWLSLPMLAAGVSLVTATGSSSTNITTKTDWTLGVASCVVSGISSAFAGVYFERFVKGMETSSLWIRNCQLSMYGLPLAVLSLLITDRDGALEGGIFQGFSAWTWGVIVLQAFGGIVVGMVVKYADNILKNFANALSVICTVICAIPLFGQYPSPWSILGEADAAEKHRPL
jgi:UDP-sugar transporter A1/2/3